MKMDIKLTGDQAICFKVAVVGSNTGEYFSSHTYYYDHKLQYRLGEKTVPIFGKIFVFKDYSEAVKYIKDDDRHMIVFRCVGNGVRRIYTNSCWPIDNKLFWKLKKQKKFDPRVFRRLNKDYKCYVSDYVIPLEAVFDNRDGVEAECFKVVSVDFDTGECFSSNTEGEGRLKYCIGQTTVPVFGKVFVFNDYNDAVSFCKRCLFCNMKVLRCFGHNVRRIYKISGDPFYDKRFWELKNKKKSDPNIVLLPAKDCYVSDSVVPLEVVFDHSVLMG
jgi:hypothetical protein